MPPSTHATEPDAMITNEAKDTSAGLASGPSASVTAKGTKLCRSLDRPVTELHRRQFAHVPARKLAALKASLEEVLALD